MKQFTRTSVYIVVSLLVHFTILLYIPNQDFEIKVKKRDLINVDLIRTPANTNISSVKVETDLSSKPSGGETAGISTKNKKGNASGMIKPDVNLPIVSVMDRLPLSNVDKMNKNAISINDNYNVNVGKEIKSAESGLSKNLARGDGKSGGGAGKSDFFEISSSTNGDRKLVYIPERPSFYLESNTKVRLRFSIDSKGIPFSVILLTKSNPEIENIAVKFVSGLRFESVPYKSVDTVEITLYFRVR